MTGSERAEYSLVEWPISMCSAASGVWSWFFPSVVRLEGIETDLVSYWRLYDSMAGLPTLSRFYGSIIGAISEDWALLAEVRRGRRRMGDSRREAVAAMLPRWAIAGYPLAHVTRLGERVRWIAAAEFEALESLGAQGVTAVVRDAIDEETLMAPVVMLAVPTKTGLKLTVIDTSGQLEVLATVARDFGLLPTPREP